MCERGPLVSRILGIDVKPTPLPPQETRLAFIRRYAEDSGQRVAALRGQRDPWWEAETTFFEVRRSRAWVMMRRIPTRRITGGN